MEAVVASDVNDRAFHRDHPRAVNAKWRSHCGLAVVAARSIAVVAGQAAPGQREFDGLLGGVGGQEPEVVEAGGGLTNEDCGIGAARDGDALEALAFAGVEREVGVAVDGHAGC